MLPCYLLWSTGGGVWGVINEFNTGRTELVAVVVNMLHMRSYGQQGGGVWVGEHVLEEYNTGRTKLVAVVNMLHMLSYGQQGGGVWRVW